MRDSWIRAWLATVAVLVGAAAIVRSRHADLIEAEEPVMDWLLDGTDISRWEILDVFGRAGVVYPLAIVLAFVAAWFSRNVAVAVVLSLALGIGVTLITKDIVDRPRPAVAAEAGLGSFPSLHVVNAGVLLGLVTLMVWWLGAPRLVVQIVAEFAIVITLLTGVGRVLSGQHWPSDLIGSAIVISLALVTAAIVFEANKPRRYRLGHAEPSHEPQNV